MDRRSLVSRCEAYLDTCNRHAVDQLATFLADRVTLNGRERSRIEHVEVAADNFRLTRPAGSGFDREG